MHEYSPHPLANIFPLMSGQEFVDLKEDIRANGLQQPICVMDGMILDGRNRFKACQEVGAELKFQEYAGKDPAAFVISLNLKRRHLTEGQRAAVAAKLANVPRGAPAGNHNADKNKCSNSDICFSGTTQAAAADMLSVSRSSVVVAAKAIKEGIPEVVQALENGQIGADRAARIASLPKDKQPEALAAKLQKSAQPKQARPKPEPKAPAVQKPEAPRAKAPEPEIPPSAAADNSPFASKHALVIAYDAVDRMAANGRDGLECLQKLGKYTQAAISKIISQPA